MALNSINTNIGAYYAQTNISVASDSASLSIARLSSGDRIVRASDDVAAMSAGTSLQTNVTTLRMALINTSQGESLLQVADGALSQITDILQRQKAIAVQAGSGSLTSAERSFLDQEFQNLTEEVDRLVDQTNFNGVTLLDGSLSERVDVDDVRTAATAATASITITTQAADNEEYVINGFILEADSNASGVTTGNAAFTIGASIEESVQNMADVLNSSTSALLTGVTFTAEGNNLVITADTGGELSETFTISTASANNSALDGVTGTATGRGVVNGAGATSVINLFTTGVNVTSTTVDATAETGTGAITETNVAAVAGTIYTIGGTDSLDDIALGINAGTSTHGFTARVIGTSGGYNIQLEHNLLTTPGNAYDPANAVDFTMAIANAGNAAAQGAGNTTVGFIFHLDGGDDLGIGAADTKATGLVGNNILTGLSQTRAESSIIFPDIADADLTSTANFGTARTITIEGVTFTFATAASAQTEAEIGTTLADTLDNMVAAINNYEGSEAENYAFQQFEAIREGTTITLRSRDIGNALDINGGTIDIAFPVAMTGVSVTSANLSNGSTNGVIVSPVTNSDFVGTIQGFDATYTGTTDRVDISLTVGSFTYTAQNVNTNVNADTTVRFSSDGGGYFDVIFAASNGESITDASDPDLAVYEQRLNAAFESITFVQNREISSYSGSAAILTDNVVTGTLIGTSFELQGSDFTDITIDEIQVNAPQGSSENGSILITINGEDYETVSDIGDQLGANAVIELVSVEDADKILTFKTGDTAIEFDTDDKASSFETSLKEAFGVGNGDAELQFQVGATVTDTLGVGINNVNTSNIYGGLDLNVLTAEAAAEASGQLDLAIDAVTGVRAEVGALQSRFNFAAANVESSLQNQDAARAVLLDTDIAAESTMFATAQVQLQAGISVLAQANQLPQNLLKLIA